jgi:hypothetical protein
MFNIDMNGLRDLHIEGLKKCVKDVASHLEKGKNLSHVDDGVNKCALQALDQNMADNPPEKEVLDDLHTLLLISIENGLDDDGNAENLKPQLDAIRNVRRKALSSPSTSTAPSGSSTDFISQLPVDAQTNILSRLTPQQLGPVKLVQKLWHQLGAEIQISMLNDAKIPLVDVLKDMTAQQALSWLKANPACKNLQYADFTKMEGFDNDCLQELVKICPNLTHLHIPNSLIPNSLIEGDALKNLKYTKDLQSLNIALCYQLERDTLKHLNNTPGLKNLNISGCYQLERDTLKHLINTPGLLSLDIKNCVTLDPDSLKNLQHIKALQSLNIERCMKLESDALKNLKYTKDLQSLNIALCYLLERDTLKHLNNTPGLKNLNISGCYKLNPETLKNLPPKLQSFTIISCPQFEIEALEDLVENMPTLQIYNETGLMELPFTFRG